MKKLVFLILIFIFTIVVLMGCAMENSSMEQGLLKRKQSQYQTTYFDLFDTATTIIGYSESQEEFQEVSDAIYEQLKKYHRLFDIYYEYEENNIKTINDQAGIAPVKVEPEIIELLIDCREYYKLTDGAVNVAMGSVLSLWHDARSAALEQPEKAEIPKKEALTEAAKHISFDNVIIDEAASTVYITDKEQRLDVGAIAKGWAVEKVCENAPAGFLVSVGGNVRATGPKPDGSSWTIGIQDPEDSNSYIEKVSITQGSVVTSGDYQRYYEVDGKKYHHLIDPKTLYPAEKWRSVTVFCEDSGLADALSTALFVLSKEEGEKILKQCGAQAMWIAKDGKISNSDINNL